MEKNSRLHQVVNSLSKNYLENQVFHLNTQLIALGDKANRKCRFCDKCEPFVSFKKKAHAIPELVNNKVLISYYECDACNEKFAKLETNFADYMNLYHTLTQVRGKKGVPTYKYGQNNSRIDLKESHMLFQDHLADSGYSFKVNKRAKSVTVFGKRTYTPIAIYKCLVKMALTIMKEEDLQYFRDTLDWLNEPNHANSKYIVTNLIAFYSFTPGAMPYPVTSVMLMKRKSDHSDPVPFMQFIIAYANFSFQIYLPMCSEDQKFVNSNMDFTAIPTPLECIPGKTFRKRDLIDFTSTIKVTAEPISAEMQFEKSHRIPEQGISLKQKISYWYYSIKKFIRNCFKRP